MESIRWRNHFDGHPRLLSFFFCYGYCFYWFLFFLSDSIYSMPWRTMVDLCGNRLRTQTRPTTKQSENKLCWSIASYNTIRIVDRPLLRKHIKKRERQRKGKIIFRAQRRICTRICSSVIHFYFISFIFGEFVVFRLPSFPFRFWLEHTSISVLSSAWKKCDGK